MTTIVATPFAAPGIGGAGKPRVRYATASAQTGNALSSHTADLFLRTAAKTAAATYGKPAKTGAAASQTADVTTAAGRQEAAKNYDAILKELRERHDEPEAMRRFDEIMRADGFVPVESGETRVALLGGYSDKATGLAQAPFALSTVDHSDLVLQMNPHKRSDSNMVLQSTLTGGYVDGQPAAAAESWAIYGADRPYSDELREYWQNRHRDSAQAEAGFDIGEYMSALPNAAQRSAVGADADIARIATGLLGKNGIQLESGTYLEFELDDNDEVVVRGTGFSPELNDLFRSSPEFQAAVKERMENPPPEDVSELAGAFADGDRSVEYTTRRTVVFSADEPSAAVVNDSLGVVGKGYTYAKKTGDYFDPNAETLGAMTGASLADYWTEGAEKAAENQAACAKAVNEALARAAETGAPVEGTATRDDIERAKAESLAAYQANRVPGKTSLPGGEARIHTTDAAENAPEAEEGTDEKTAGSAPEAVMGKDYQRARQTIEDERKAAVQTIIGRIRGQYAGILSQPTGRLHWTR